MNNRSSFFDSLKFVLIFLVVFNHILEKEALTNHNKLFLCSFIQTFSMPLFIFISGFFSKNITWSKFIKSFKSIFLTYLVFQTIFSSYSLVQGHFNIWSFLTKPAGVLWYLAGLLVWRFFMFLFTKLKIPGIFIFFISVSCSVGLFFLPESFPSMRIFVFFPYFVLGYYCTDNTIQKIRNLNKNYTAVIFLASLVFIYYFANINFGFTLFRETTYSFYPKTFALFGTILYSFNSSIYVGLLYKIITFFFAITFSICFINLVPDRFHKLGKKTMEIYLLHLIFVGIYFLISWQLNINSWIIVDVFITIITIQCCILLTRLKLVQYLINPILLFQKNNSERK